MPLLHRLREQLTALRESAPGDRFQHYHQRFEAAGRRPLRLMAGSVGVLLIAGGLVTYPIPGPPSTLMVLTGSLFVSRASPRAARMLDGLELRARRRFSRFRGR